MCNTTDPKVLMEKNGKTVPFSPGAVDYMESHGWSVVEPEPATEPDPEPEETDEPTEAET